jgi:NAD+ diphosphatase
VVPPELAPGGAHSFAGVYDARRLLTEWLPPAGSTCPVGRSSGTPGGWPVSALHTQSKQGGRAGLRVLGLDGPHDEGGRRERSYSPGVELSPEATAEVERLVYRYGTPRRIRAPIDASFDDPIRKPDRVGEVCMVVQRPSGTLLVSIKTFYPRGAYRLPTGGIHPGEKIADALVREAREETGLDLEIMRFLAHISYVAPDDARPLFHTFAFLLEEHGGTLGALDESEQIEEWREIGPDELPAVADFLDDLREDGARSIGGSWRAWGKFRAVVHRVVHEALTSRGGRSGTR